MASRLAQLRSHAFRAQSARCFYCGAHMWTRNPEAFAAARGISLADARRFQATAEHLQAKCDGGADALRNIAAACAFCNKKRHQRKAAPSPEAYRAYVQRRISIGRWHPAHLLGRVLSGTFQGVGAGQRTVDEDQAVCGR